MSNICVNITPAIPKELPLTDNDIFEIVVSSIKKLRPGLTNKLEIEIIFANEEEMRSLNNEHRKIDKSTDVLSFPQEQFPESLVNILGSIVICLNKVSEKKEDPSDVIKHGLLHLLGFDHETDEKNWSEAADKIDCEL